MYIFSNQAEVHEPLYDTTISLYPWEYELLQTRPVRRLKFLSHYGTGSFVTSVKHSRYEHTIGVWTLIATFFPKDEELRIAALLHDIGHLPFSHAVEKTLGFNHHHITEEKIRSEEVTSILVKHHFLPERIIDLLNQDTPLSHKTPYICADHLDSFLRDAYMLGKKGIHPSEVIRTMSFNQQYVDADYHTSKHIMLMIYHDHTSFLSPKLLALDALLAKAISEYARDQFIDIQQLTNNELIQVLVSSENVRVKEIMNIILWEPERIKIHHEQVDNAEKVEVRKVYDKTPLVDGVPLISICSESKHLLQSIRALQKDYYISY
ncbi:HD domain-containing protein [Bacillus salitolerans]|uniref:HD domain-containing protein n=1 Tax=Bacillus salitolerans TaxID=1437434 RepID=A0ABW4M050_9BACI